MKNQTVLMDQSIQYLIQLICS